MANVKIELDEAGIRELLQSDGMRAAVESAVAQKAQQAGEGYSHEVHSGQKRVYANIFPATQKAAHDNYENNTLEKVIRS